MGKLWNDSKKGLRKKLLLGAGALFVIAFIWHLIWISSGSGEWEFFKEENGIKIYTLKTPGAKALKSKAVFRIQSNLAGIIKLVEDTSSYEDIGIEKPKLIDPIYGPGYYTVYSTYILELPFPFQTRECVLLTQRYQDPASKKIEINVIAAPNKIPPNEAYLRIVHLHNRYLITPLENQEVEIDFQHEFDLGGSVPYFIKNLMGPVYLYEMMSEFKKLLSMDKYKNAKLSYIKELK